MAQRLPRSLRAFYREIRGDGWTWHRCGSGHIQFRHDRAKFPVTAASSTRDTNAERILRREMQRALEGAQ